jgi:alpha-mannosidase
LVELDGAAQKDVRISFPAAIGSAREINAAEEPVGSASVEKGALVTDFTAYQPRTFAVKLSASSVQLEAPHAQQITLTYDRSVATFDGKPGEGSFDRDGRAWPAEFLPEEIAYNGIKFHLAPAGTGTPNSVTAEGQTIALPQGPYNRVYLLAAASEGDPTATFKVGDQSTDLMVEHWTDYIGQWDKRKWKDVERPLPQEPAANDDSRQARRARREIQEVKENGPIMDTEYAGLSRGYIKPGPVAWYLSHRHRSDGSNEIYSYSYLFAYPLEVPAGAKTITLPYDKRIRILAATAVQENGRVQPAQVLIDTLPHLPESEMK